MVSCPCVVLAWYSDLLGELGIARAAETSETYDG